MSPVCRGKYTLIVISGAEIKEVTRNIPAGREGRGKIAAVFGQRRNV